MKKCLKCNIYTLKNNCPKCNNKTISAHYKFVQINLKKVVSNNEFKNLKDYNSY